VEVNPKHSRELKENFFPEAAEYSLLDDLLGDSANPQAALEALMVVTPHAAHLRRRSRRSAWAACAGGETDGDFAGACAGEDRARTGKLLDITFQAPYTAETLRSGSLPIE
jgi:hypothetical protein